jgi:hypothetical protein
MDQISVKKMCYLGFGDEIMRNCRMFIRRITIDALFIKIITGGSNVKEKRKNIS